MCVCACWKKKKGGENEGMGVRGSKETNEEEEHGGPWRGLDLWRHLRSVALSLRVSDV